MDNKVTYDYTQKLYLADKTLYGNAVDASKNENGYTIDAAHITDAIEQTPAAIDSNTLQDAAGTNLSPKATVVESKASINLYTVDANGVETVIKAGDSFEVANAANIFKAVQYTPTAGTEVTSDEFGAYATDSLAYG